MDIPLQGSLRSFKFPDLLTFLSLCQRSGTLEIEGSGRKASLYFRNGSILYAVSDQERLRLGNLMQRQGLIDRARWESLERRMLHLGERFGRVAVEENVITSEQLLQLLKVQVSEIVYDCFTWNDGTFSFLDVLALPEFAVTIAIDTSNLIMEGARRIDEWQECQQLFPDAEVVFCVQPAPEVKDKIVLTLAEWKILFLIDGTRTLSQVTDASGLEALEVYRVVYGLVANKLVKKTARPAPHDTVSSPPAPESSSASPVAASGAPAPVAPAVPPSSPPSEPPIAATPSAAAPVVPPAAPAPELGETVMFGDTRLLVSPDARLQQKDVVRVAVARLVAEGSDKRVFLLTDDGCTLGRLAENRIQLSDPGISGVHARVSRGPEGDVLEDLGSKNGCYVNGARVERRLLQDGDRLRLSNTVLVYKLVQDARRVGGA